MPISEGSDARGRQPADTAELLRQVADHLENPTLEGLAVDMRNIWEWADALQRQVNSHEGLTEGIQGMRDNLATIAAALDPALTQHVAELDAKLERHDLLLSRLLDQK